MGKKDVGIVEETVMAAYEVDAHKRKQEVAEGVEAEKKIEELNKQKREATNSNALENFDGKRLDYFEGYLTSLTHQDKFKQMQTAMALYYINKHQLYKERGFNNFVDYCKAIGMSKGAGYEWVKNVEEFGIKDFSNLLEKVGANLRFFREVKALPEEVKDAVVKGEKIEVNGKEYDLAKGGKELREVVKALVHEVNANKQSRGAYETHKQWNEKIAKKEREIERLKEQIEDANMPPEDKEAIKKIETLKTQMRGIIRIWESADLKKYGDDVQAELVLAAEYAHDRSKLCLSRILELVRGTLSPLEIEEAEIEFKKKYS